MKDAEENPNEDDFGPPSRRHIPRPVMIISILIVVGVLTLGSFTLIHLSGDQNQAPAPMVEPGSNLLYIEASPPWGSVSIDGRPVSSLPIDGVDQPLQLSVGAHVVKWHADPFPPQYCNLFVPLNVITTPCLSSNTVPVPKHPGLTADLLTFAASTTMLPNTQRTALFHTAQATLLPLQSPEVVQSGEQFVALQSPHFIATATQPLRATPHFQLDTTANSNAPCQSEFIESLNSCGIQGQNCHLFCAFGENVPTTLTAKRQAAWIVFAALRATWEYSTLSGQVIARSQPDEPDNTATEYLITLAITWVGSSWHVTVSPFLASPAGPACAAANVSISQSTSLQTAGSNSTLSVAWEFASGLKSGADCLAKAFLTSEIQNTPPPKPIAICLYRFGVLIAIDATAHHYWRTLPIADAYEQHIAQQLESFPSYL